jgi:uncharacterized protein (DUF2062 family)/2-polyprenyl-3-methyl-5-hydroxy-6-metoxy-1,4-benzoquinol methylase
VRDGTAQAPERALRADAPVGLRARLRARVSAIVREHAAPPRLFAACVVGAIVGCTPFFGFHLPLCLALAALLRLNRAATYAAANVSIPPVAPFLAVASISIGARLRHAPVAIGVAEARKLEPWALARAASGMFADWVIGAPFVGLAIGGVLGGMVYLAARRREARSRDPFELAAAEVVARFAHEKPGIFHYVRWKIRLDPVYRAVLGGLPDRVRLLDLGGGLGLLAQLAVALGTQRAAHVVEWDEAKVAAGTRAAAGLPIAFERADLRVWAPDDGARWDVIALCDVLHYFDAATQLQLLDAAADRLADGGVLMVRDGDLDRRGARLTRAIERLAVTIGWNRSAARPEFGSMRALADHLAARGMEVELGSTAGPLHPGNVLLRARRVEAGRAAPDAV